MKSIATHKIYIIIFNIFSKQNKIKSEQIIWKSQKDEDFDKKIFRDKERPFRIDRVIRV